MRWTSAFALAVIILGPARAWAQGEAISTAPPNLVIANYNSTAVGPYGGLEGTAYVARIDDPAAAWFNPAGLARQGAPQISGSAGVYQRTLIEPRGWTSGGGALQQLPNFVGFTFVPREGLTVGASFLSTNAWEQEIHAEQFLPTGNGQQRFAYGADSSFSQRVAAVSFGYHRKGPWRVGGGFAISMMDLGLVQSVSDRLADSSGLRSLLVTARASGSAFQLRSQGGVQFDAGAWRFGGSVRTPGLSFYRSGIVTLDGVISEPGSTGASLFDTDAKLEYHLPWEFQGGVAYSTARVELEIDLLGYTPIGAYSVLSSGNPVLVYKDNGPGVQPSVTSRPFAGLTSASVGVVNVAAGGHWRVIEGRDFRVHAGIGSNRSPVAPAETIFNKVDLTAWSVGASGTFGKLQFSAGLNRQSGSANDVTVRNLLNGQTITTPVNVRIAGFIYSLAYQF